ncbi:hypothetical protein [Kallipyga massiliensis]|uniref:hypothetical protein n=1 Tax=Kallipyga massiliensis TaxID=1472764 RepID=UPI0026EAC54F|nr:hypothetical protein [Kallipyga massiliensis]
MLKNEILTVYQEIKHPYTKLNLSYHLFKIGGSMALALFFFNLIAGVIQTVARWQGNMVLFKQIAVNSAYSDSLTATLCLLFIVVSYLLRKKI